EQEVPYLVEDPVAHGLQLEQRVHDRAERLEALTEEEQALLGSVLLQLLVEQGPAGTVVDQLLLHVAAEHHPLIVAGVEQAAAELDRLPQRVPHVPQLLGEVAGDDRASHGVDGEVVQLEVPLHAPQQHLELEEPLLPAPHPAAAEPAPALGGEPGVRLAVPDQVAEVVAGEAHLAARAEAGQRDGHAPWVAVRAQKRAPCTSAGGGLSKYLQQRAVATRPRGVRWRNPSCIRKGS